MSRLEVRCRHRYGAPLPGGFTLDVEFRADHASTALFGPSGSGKTSLLSMIAGLLPPDAGRIVLADRPLFDSVARVNLPPEQRRIGYVFQDHLLFPHRTVEGNLRYGLRRAGKVKRKIEFDRVADVLELRPLLARYPRNLSGGERQRTALGRALLSQPELLLLDEPWSALDDALKHRVLAYLERVQAEFALPTLLVSHDAAAVRRLAEWVVVLDGGRVVAEGTPEDALSQSVPLAWKDSARPANLLRLDYVERHEGHWRGRVGEQWLHLPPPRHPPARTLYVEFFPGEVTLARGEPQGLSMRNRLRGKVGKITTVPAGVFVAVDVGQIVWSEITPEAAAELQLAVGVEVTCLVKTHSLRVAE